MFSRKALFVSLSLPLVYLFNEIIIKGKTLASEVNSLVLGQDLYTLTIFNWIPYKDQLWFFPSFPSSKHNLTISWWYRNISVNISSWAVTWLRCNMRASTWAVLGDAQQSGAPERAFMSITEASLHFDDIGFFFQYSEVNSNTLGRKIYLLFYKINQWIQGEHSHLQVIF